MKTKRLSLFLLLFLTVIAMTLYAYLSRPKKGEALFSYCKDGDSAVFVIDGEEKECRFLGIDTPETGEPYAKEAKDLVKDTLSKAKRIVLEEDGESEQFDRYGRYLVWVFADGELLQEKLLEKGYARTAYIYGDYSYLDRLEAAEKKASDEKQGIWSLSED